jgi:hypothetical protein
LSVPSVWRFGIRAGLQQQFAHLQAPVFSRPADERRKISRGHKKKIYGRAPRARSIRAISKSPSHAAQTSGRAKLFRSVAFDGFALLCERPA